MNDFEKLLKAALPAGWTVWLLGLVGLLFEWGCYFALMKSQPQWFLDLWGGGMKWESLSEIWGSALIHYKCGLAFFLLLLVWGWLLVRRLKATNGS